FLLLAAGVGHARVRSLELDQHQPGAGLFLAQRGRELIRGGLAGRLFALGGPERRRGLVERGGVGGELLTEFGGGGLELLELGGEKAAGPLRAFAPQFLWVAGGGGAAVWW